jgi:PAS domain S-box-containing protein
VTAIPGRAGKLSLEGYRSTRVLRDAGRTRVHAAIREHDQLPVVIKLYELEADEGIEMLIEHEFRRLRALELAGVVPLLALEHLDGEYARIQAWSSGIPLDEYCRGQALALPEFMQIAERIVEILAAAHAHDRLHCDLKPSNVFIDPHTRALELGDFAITPLLDADRQRISDAWVVERCLPYVAPEQTGRTHRSVDVRSDLYSLGVVFYELLTGRRPFEATTPLELIHAHLARRPQAPQRLRPDLPTLLSAIVMKLLEKAPERRYQSARGLLIDLRRIGEAAAAPGGYGNLEGLVLGVGDVPTVLQLPHRLYGRTREVNELVQAFRDASRGRAHCVFVSGPLGSGKTALVNQLTAPVLSRHGFFARGKFEREQRDTPYAGIYAAFANLADQLLTQSDQQLAIWRAKLLERLGPGAAVFVELVPHMRAVLGPVAPARALGPVESRNQLALACASVIAEFARPEHPLVLVLDGFQWADAASCELLAALLGEPDTALLVVATLREDEIDDDAPILHLRDSLERRRGGATSFELGPLGDDDIASMVADSLGLAREQVRPLAAIVGRNTDRNPAFVGQYLSHLVELALLRPTGEGWTWDVDAIAGAGIPEDLLTLARTKLQRLGQQQRELLSAAAVIGSRFDIATLTALVGADTVAAALVPLTQEGLLTTLRGGRYGFAHDQLREAAYRMNSTARRVELHRVVGQTCLARLSAGEIEESIFEVVDHVDIGCGLVPLDDEEPAHSRARAREALAHIDPDQRLLLAELNALAGHNSLIGAGLRAAIRYFEAGIQLLAGVRDFAEPEPEAEIIEFNDELRFVMELGRCEALGLVGEREASERCFDRLLRAPLAYHRIGRAIASRVEVRITASDRAAAVACGLEGLARLDIHPVVAAPSPEQMPLHRLVPMLRSHELQQLAERATIADQRHAAALDILAAIIPVSHLTDPELHVAFLATHTQIMLEHGRHRSAPVALSYAAMFVGTAVGQRQLALQIAELARALASQEGPGAQLQRIEPPYWTVASWVRPYAEGLAPLRESVELALAAGDLEIACYATDMTVTMSLSAGVHLQALERTAESATRRLRQWQSPPLLGRAEAYLAFARTLLSGDESQLELGDVATASFGRGETEHRETDYMIRLLRARTRCMFGHWPQAFADLEAMDDFPRVVSGAWQLCDYALFHGLSAAALQPSADEDRREALLWIVRLSYEQLLVSAELAPANCLPRAALIEAELATLEGSGLEALAAYTQARRRAAEHQLPWLEALALERQGEYLVRVDMPELASGPLREARACYARWGALTKAAELERRHPSLVEELRVSERRGRVGEGTASRALDLASILKASQAIAGDIQLSDVVDRVMAIALENAGAERGALLLPGEQGLELTARCEAEGPSSGFLRVRVPIAAAADRVPVSLLRWVERTREPTILDDATKDLRFAGDPYVLGKTVRSILCLPIVKHDRMIGLLYLENRLSSGAFNVDRLELLRLLMTQAASALENAQLFEALRSSEVRWRLLVEGLPDVIMLLDPHGQLEFINHWSSDDAPGEGLLGRRLDRLVEPNHRAQVDEQLVRAVREMIQTELDVEATFRQGRRRWYHLRLAPIAVDGRVERVIAVAADVTEAREAARVREQVDAQRRQQQRLESIGTLASGVAHEINNPVQGIMNYAELISHMSDISDDAREFAGEIHHESQRVATIVRSLLSFSREEHEQSMSHADVREIIEGTLSLIRTVIGKDQIQLAVHAPTEPVLLECRAQQIRQVVMNLVTNARDAVTARWPDFHEDKRIDIRVRRFLPPGEAHQAWVRISVSDQGGGVPPEVVGRIFDPFFTTKGRDQGTGLGLSVSHGIIRDHDGDLRLENHAGVGATFHIELPLMRRRKG